MGVRFLLRGDENVLELHTGDGFNLRYILNTWNGPLQKVNPMKW